MSDEVDIEEEDTRPKKDFDVIVKQEIYVRLRVSARDEEEAKEVGSDALHKMRYKTYISDYDGRDLAETIGIVEGAQLCKQIHFDLPERPDTEDLEVEEV